jgi:PleD family two-component response regulator
MTSQIEIRVTLRNLQAVKERLDQDAMDRLLQGIGSFLQKRLRGTDHMERDARGEFCLSIRNVDSNCLPSLQRRFSPMMLDSHFSKSENGSIEFAVETNVMACQAATLPDESLEELAHRR